MNSSNVSRNSSMSAGTVRKTKPKASSFTVIPFAFNAAVGHVAPSANWAITSTVRTEPSGLKLAINWFLMAAVSTGHAGDAFEVNDMPFGADCASAICCSTLLSILVMVLLSLL